MKLTPPAILIFFTAKIFLKNKKILDTSPLSEDKASLTQALAVSLLRKRHWQRLLLRAAAQCIT